MKKEVALSELANLNGGKMFGYESKQGPCINGSRRVTNTLTVFWIPITQEVDMPC
ncbi:hypothetical protein [Porphyromonas somerae]|uniref:hypothetical protein n=1 Tax=Porphyromonas somerae TaxID=322095 RepID=UPI002698C8D5|nr:hypothetical protein [Porphyromonas somerae]MDY3884876.1 hypothetical protein [Porphyromonas somerae]